MHTLTVYGATAPILQDLLTTLAEMATPKWAKGAPSFLQVMVRGSSVMLTTASLWVVEELRNRYRLQRGVADGCVTRVE